MLWVDDVRGFGRLSLYDYLKLPFTVPTKDSRWPPLPHRIVAALKVLGMPHKFSDTHLTDNLRRLLLAIFLTCYSMVRQALERKHVLLLRCMSYLAAGSKG